jgi:hypothetical protein
VGFALFKLFLGSDVKILRQMVETLGRLPDPWWAAFEQRALWFEGDRQPTSGKTGNVNLELFLMILIAPIMTHIFKKSF